MGFLDKGSAENRSLLRQEDLEQKIKARIRNSGKGATRGFFITAGLFSLTGLILFILAYTAFPERPPNPYNYPDHTNDQHDLYWILGLLFILFGPCISIGGCLMLCYMRNKQDTFEHMFGTNLIGYFVFDSDYRWRAFADHQWNFTSKMMIIAYVISFVLMACGAIPFGIAFDTIANKGVLFAITWVPFIGFALLIMTLVVSLSQYQRFRKFRPEVHCTVFSRGCFYQLGNFLMLQHINKAPRMQFFNLTSVVLTREKKSNVDMPILHVTAYTINHKGNRITLNLQAPVPEQMTGAVASWLPPFAEPLGVRPTIAQEFIHNRQINHA